MSVSITHELEVFQGVAVHEDRVGIRVPLNHTERAFLVGVAGTAQLH